MGIVVVQSERVPTPRCHPALQVQDRLKIRKRGMGEDVMLGRQSFLNCAPYEGLSGGCDGGDPIDIFKYMAQHGLPDESCYSCALPPVRLPHTALDR